MYEISLPPSSLLSPSSLSLLSLPPSLPPSLSPSIQRTEDDVSVHDQLIWNLHINGIDELLVFLGGSAEESQWCMHVLEIIFLIFREQVSQPTTFTSNFGRCFFYLSLALQFFFCSL